MENKIITKGRKKIFCKQENYFFCLTEDSSIELFVNDKVSITIFSSNYTLDLKIHLREQGDVSLFFASLTERNLKHKIAVYHEEEKTKSNVICHGVSIKNYRLIFDVRGYIPKGIVSCVCNQESIIHTLDDGEGEIHPNLYIDEFDVEANHSSFIGPFKEDVMFYLATKGIKRKTSKKLLLEAFLIPKEDVKEELKKAIETIIFRR